MKSLIATSFTLGVILVFSPPGSGETANAGRKDKGPPKSLNIDGITRGLNRLAGAYNKAETTAQKQVVVERIRKAMASNVDGRTFKFTCKIKDVKKAPYGKDDVWDIHILETAEFKKYHAKKLKVGEVKFTQPTMLRVVMTAEQATKIGKDELMFVSGVTTYEPGLSIYVGASTRLFKIAAFDVAGVNAGSVVSTDYTCQFQAFKAKSPF